MAVPRDVSSVLPMPHGVGLMRVPTPRMNMREREKAGKLGSKGYWDTGLLRAIFGLTNSQPGSGSGEGSGGAPGGAFTNRDGEDYFPGQLVEWDGVSYQIGGKIRSQPVAPDYLERLMAAVYATDPSLQVRIHSGGQTRSRDPDLRGKPGGWTGSTRHNVDEDGWSRTADLRLYRDGKPLSVTDDKELYLRFAENAAAMGFPGIGVDVGGNYMHVGGGSEAAWGYGPEGGKAKYLPADYGEAIERGRQQSADGVGSTLLGNYQAGVPTPRVGIPGPRPADLPPALAQLRKLPSQAQMQAIRDPMLPPPLPRRRPDAASVLSAASPQPLPDAAMGFAPSALGQKPLPMTSNDKSVLAEPRIITRENIADMKYSGLGRGSASKSTLARYGLTHDPFDGLDEVYTDAVPIDNATHPKARYTSFARPEGPAAGMPRAAPPGPPAPRESLQDQLAAYIGRQPAQAPMASAPQPAPMPQSIRQSRTPGGLTPADVEDYVRRQRQQQLQEQLATHVAGLRPQGGMSAASGAPSVLPARLPDPSMTRDVGGRAGSTVRVTRSPPAPPVPQGVAGLVPPRMATPLPGTRGEARPLPPRMSVRPTHNLDIITGIDVPIPGAPRAPIPMPFGTPDGARQRYAMNNAPRPSASQAIQTLATIFGGFGMGADPAPVPLPRRRSSTQTSSTRRSSTSSSAPSQSSQSSSTGNQYGESSNRRYVSSSGQELTQQTRREYDADTNRFIDRVVYR